MLARCVPFGALLAARQVVSGTGMRGDDEYRHGVKGTTGLHDSRESQGNRGGVSRPPGLASVHDGALVRRATSRWGAVRTADGRWAWGMRWGREQRWRTVVAGVVGGGEGCAEGAGRDWEGGGLGRRSAGHCWKRTRRAERAFKGGQGRGDKTATSSGIMVRARRASRLCCDVYPCRMGPVWIVMLSIGATEIRTSLRGGAHLVV